MNGISAALYGTLSADSTLTTLAGGTRVYQDLAPQGAAHPLTVFSLVSGLDNYTFGQRSWVDSLWQVRVFDVGPSSARAGSMVDRIDAVLTDGNITVNGTAALVVRRMESLPALTEVDEDSGQHYRSTGARYQIGVRDA